MGGRCEGEVLDRAGEDVQHTCVYVGRVLVGWELTRHVRLGCGDGRGDGWGPTEAWMWSERARSGDDESVEG